MSASKTPQFDALLDTILEKVAPHVRPCAECKKDFSIFAEDIGFYHMLRVPPPTLCPDCRNRRRLSFANYSSIYKRPCDAPGHTDTMISLVAPIVPWVAYDYATYYSDEWDPRSYARDIEDGKSFLGQFLELLKVVPQPGVRRGSDSPNSDFSFYGKNMKDCYYVFGGRRSEDILYSASIYLSTHIVDSYFLSAVDTGFENVGTLHCNKVFFAYFSTSCINSDFIFDCRNCQDCFGCVNLRNKQYCMWNVQLTKEEYKEKRAAIDLGSQTQHKKYQTQFWDFVKANPIEAVRMHQSENVSGNDIKNSQDCYRVFQISQSQNVRYAYFGVMSMQDSMDISFAGKAERLYETQNVGTKSSNVKFSFAVKESSYCEFAVSCENCTYCFGCIGLKNASYCIFNKQYEPEEYFKKLDEIKTAMLSEGAYGEFFPMSFAPYAYNSSLAHITYPMTEDEARGRGLLWQPDAEIDTTNIQTINPSELPENIADVTDNVCSQAIIGHYSGKPFRLIPREVAFYKRYNLPLPVDTPYQRILDRFKIMHINMYPDVCHLCRKEILSAYKTSEGYKPYCSQCYQQEFL